MTSFVATVVEPGVSPSESDASVPALKKSGSSPICDQDPPSRSSRRGSLRNKVWWAEYYQNDVYEYSPVSVSPSRGCRRRRTSDGENLATSAVVVDPPMSDCGLAVTNGISHINGRESQHSNSTSRPGSTEVSVGHGDALTSDLADSAVPGHVSNHVCPAVVQKGAWDASVALPDELLPLSGLSDVGAGVGSMPAARRIVSSDLDFIALEFNTRNCDTDRMPEITGYAVDESCLGAERHNFEPAAKPSKKPQPVPLDPDYDKPGPSGLCNPGQRRLRCGVRAKAPRYRPRSSSSDSSSSETSWPVDAWDSDFQDPSAFRKKRRKMSPAKRTKSSRSSLPKSRKIRRLPVSSDTDEEVAFFRSDSVKVHPARRKSRLTNAKRMGGRTAERKRMKSVVRSEKPQVPWREDEVGLQCLKCKIHVDSSDALIAHLNVHCRNGFRFPGDQCKTLLVRLSKLPQFESEEEVQEYFWRESESSPAPVMQHESEQNRPQFTAPGGRSSSAFVDPVLMKTPANKTPFDLRRVKIPDEEEEPIEEDEVYEATSLECKMEERVSQRKYLSRISAFKPEGTDRVSLVSRNKELEKLSWILDPYGTTDFEMEPDIYSLARSPSPVSLVDDEKSGKKPAETVEAKTRGAFGLLGPEWSDFSLCGNCGSGGARGDDFVLCYVCCESYHWFCAAPCLTREQRRCGSFVCRDCLTCCACGESGDIEFSCGSCCKSYHRRCFTSPLPDVLGRRERNDNVVCDDDVDGHQGWFCLDCTPCQSCGGSSGEQTEFVIEGRMYVCEACRRLQDSSSLCQLCLKADDPSEPIYDLTVSGTREEVEESVEVLWCRTCKGKVHARCELLSSDEVIILRRNRITFECSCCSLESSLSQEQLNERYGLEFLRHLRSFMSSINCDTYLPETVVPSQIPVPAWRRQLRESMDAFFLQILDDFELRWRTEEEHLTQSVDQKQAEVIRKIQSIRGGIGNGRFPTVSSFCAEFEGVLEFVEMEVDEIEEELRRHFPHYLRRRGGSEVCARSSFVASVRPPFDDDHNYCRASEPSEITTRTAVHREGARGTPGVTPDTRWCAVCRRSGDSELCERLIYLGRELSDTHSSDGNQAVATCWAHANCLLWLPDVERRCDWRGTTLHGVAESVAAVDVGESLCCACGRSRASLRCRFAAGGSECRRVYHFPCAVESGCALGPSALVLCDEHARFMPPTGRVKRFAQTVPIFVDGAANYWSLSSSLSSSSWNSSLTFACGSFKVRVRDDGLELTRWFWSGSAPTEAVPYRIVIRLASTFEVPNAAPVAGGVSFPADFFFNHTGKNEECSDLSVRMKSLQALMAVRSSGWLPDHSMSLSFGGRIYVASDDDGFAEPAPPAVGRRPSGSVLLVLTGGMTPDKLSHVMQDGVFEKLGLSARKTRLCLAAAAKFFARNRAARRARFDADALAASRAAAATAADYDGDEEVRISQLDGAFDQPQQYVSASGGGGVGEVAQVVHFTPAAQVSSAPFASSVANQVLLLDLAGCSNVTSSLMQRKAELAMGESARFLVSIPGNMPVIPPQPVYYIPRQDQGSQVVKTVYKALNGMDGKLYIQSTFQVPVPPPVVYQVVGVPSQPAFVPVVLPNGQVPFQTVQQPMQVLHHPGFSQIVQPQQQHQQHHHHQQLPQNQVVYVQQPYLGVPQVQGYQQASSSSLSPAAFAPSDPGLDSWLISANVGQEPGGAGQLPAPEPPGAVDSESVQIVGTVEYPASSSGSAVSGPVSPTATVSSPATTATAAASRPPGPPPSVPVRTMKPVVLTPDSAAASVSPPPPPPPPPMAAVGPTPGHRLLVDAVMRRLQGRVATSTTTTRTPSEASTGSPTPAGDRGPSSSSSSSPLSSQEPPKKRDRLLDKFRNFMRTHSGERRRTLGSNLKVEPFWLNENRETGRVTSGLPRPTKSAAVTPGGKENESPIVYELKSADGSVMQGESLEEIWNSVVDTVQKARKEHGLPVVAVDSLTGICRRGIDHDALSALLMLLPPEQRNRTKFVFQVMRGGRKQEEPDTGSARTDGLFSVNYDPKKKRPRDMFSWLASAHRPFPVLSAPSSDSGDTNPPLADKKARQISKLTRTLPLLSRYQMLRDGARQLVGGGGGRGPLFVHRSHIHGRGLFTRRALEPGDLVVEYLGEYVRSCVADKREKLYTSASLGCYMFRVDDEYVLDATKRGNCARFINHSCEPNCHSKVAFLRGKKRILIVALKDVAIGEELTYNYKFPPDKDDRLPCHCRSAKCRKYLN